MSKSGPRTKASAGPRCFLLRVCVPARFVTRMRADSLAGAPHHAASISLQATDEQNLAVLKGCVKTKTRTKKQLSKRLVLLRCAWLKGKNGSPDNEKRVAVLEEWVNALSDDAEAAGPAEGCVGDE